MADASDPVYKSRSQLLAKAIDLSADGRDMWRPDELGAILKHQLSAPLRLDLAGRFPERADEIKALTRSVRPHIKTFWDLLFHPRPPVKLLDLAKEFAKGCQAHPERSIPYDIAMALYVAVIVVARMRCGESISQLQDDVLRDNLKWCLSREWLNDDMRTLFKGARDELRKA